MDFEKKLNEAMGLNAPGASEYPSGADLLGHFMKEWKLASCQLPPKAREGRDFSREPSPGEITRGTRFLWGITTGDMEDDPVGTEGLFELVKRHAEDLANRFGKTYGKVYIYVDRPGFDEEELWVSTQPELEMPDFPPKSESG